MIPFYRAFSSPSRRSVVGSVLAAAALMPALASAQSAPPTPAANPPQVGATTYRPIPTALTVELEKQRVAAATALYGSADIRPLDQRKTSIVTLGDSEISGEGTGDRSLYEAGTDGPDNWCHRSKLNAARVSKIPVDVKENFACSGGQSVHMEYGGARLYGENQGEKLAVLARNTHVKLIWMTVGANDEEGLEFSPTMTECTEARVWVRGNCYPQQSASVKTRTESVTRTVTKGIQSIQKVMADAGYLPGDYQILLAGYPSPVSPDVEDNPNFPGWYAGGCTLYLKDAGMGRNKVVPMFNDALALAAKATGVRWMDLRWLYNGHEPCSSRPFVTGVLNMGSPFKGNDWRQSWHPNVSGHAAFAACMDQAWGRNDPVASCVEPLGKEPSAARYIPYMPTSNALRFSGSGYCMNLNDYNTRNGTDVITWHCTDALNEGWVYDTTSRTIHAELTYDRCLEAGENPKAGDRIFVWKCNGLPHQAWRMEGGVVRLEKFPDLCLNSASAEPGHGYGAKVTLAACNPADLRQQVTVPLVQERKSFELTDGRGQCLDVPPNGFSGGVRAMPLTVYDCDGGEDQYWRYDAHTGVINNRSDGFCLDAGLNVTGSRVSLISCSVHQEAQYRNNGIWSVENGYVFLRGNPNLVVTSHGKSNNLTMEPRKAGNIDQIWTANGKTSLRNGFGFDDWLSGAMY